MFTKYKNGAEEGITEVYKYVSGAEQGAEGVYAYKNGAEERVYPVEEYLIKNGSLVGGYSTATYVRQDDYASKNNCDASITAYANRNGYYYVYLDIYCISDGSNSGEGYVVFSPSVDVSNYSKVYIEMTSSEMTPLNSQLTVESSQRVFLSNDSSKYSDGTVLATAIYEGKSDNGYGLYSIDVSELDSVGYLKLVIAFEFEGTTYSYRCGHTTNIYNMWME